MAKNPSAPARETTPSSFPETPPPTTFDMPSYTTQMVFEINGTLGRIDEKLNSLEKRVEGIRSDLKTEMGGLDERLRSIEKHWHWIAGGIAAAIFLIPISGWFIWIGLQDKIEAILKLIQK